MQNHLPDPFVERRKFVRLNASCDVSYKVLDKKPITLDKFKTKNISAGGICFIAAEPLDPGNSLELDFNLLDKRADVRAKARVVWTRPFQIGNEPEHYDCGIEFTEITPADRERINSYVFSYK